MLHTDKSNRERPQSLQTIREASQLLKMSPGFLYRLPKGTPGVYRIGGSIRIDLNELVAGMNKR